MGSDPATQRPVCWDCSDLIEQWQQDQHEFFTAPVLEVVSEYARWREASLMGRLAEKLDREAKHYGLGRGGL